MNVVLEDKKVGLKLKIFYCFIIAICVISIVVAMIVQSKADKKENLKASELGRIAESKMDTYKDEFNNIFQNKVNYLENNSYKISRVDTSKEIVYTGYENNEKKANNYDLDVCIPYINIDNEIVEGMNNEIRSTFQKKTTNILNSNNIVIFSVKYSAYVTNNILSVIIRATLKEDDKPQRTVIKTYNYNLVNQNKCTVQDILKMKGIQKEQANDTIKNEIKKEQSVADDLSKMGFNVYSRDLNSDIYDVNNIEEFFLGKDDALYIIFAYGNSTATTELDLIVM